MHSYGKMVINKSVVLGNSLSHQLLTYRNYYIWTQSQIFIKKIRNYLHEK